MSTPAEHAAILDGMADDWRAGNTADGRVPRNQEADALAAGAAALRNQGWRDIASAPKDGTPFLVYWSRSLMGKAEVDKLSGWSEYEEILGYGEPPAVYWCPIPPVPPATETS